MTEKKNILKIMGVAAAVCFFMKYVLPKGIPFFIAWILVKTLNPLLKKIRSRLPWKKEILLSILVFLLFFLTGLLLYALGQAVMEQIEGILSNFDRYYQQAELFLQDCCRMLEKKTGLEAGNVRNLMNRGMERLQGQIDGTILPGLLNHSMQYLVGMVKVLGFLFLIYVAMLLLMKDYERIKKDLEPYQLYQSTVRVTERIFQIAGAYLRSQVLIMAIVTAICIGGYYLLKNPYALLAGLVTGILDAIPFLGTGTVLLPLAAVLFLKKNYAAAAGYTVLFLITYVLREVLEPRLVGDRIGIYPFVFALSVYAGLCLFGPIGVVTGPISMILTIEISKEWLRNGKESMDINSKML